jgi:hypothetical protein
MKKKNRLESDQKILAGVMREMDEPRLAASVRNALEADAALAARVPVAHPSKA